MLNTVTGMRYPEAAENALLVFGGSKLVNYIMGKVRSDDKKIEHEGVIIKPVKENSAFHGLSPKEQIILVQQTLALFVDPNSQNPMTQFANATLESIYSCIFHEVKCEIGKHLKADRRSARNQVYFAWEYWFDGIGTPLSINSTDLNEWVGIIDKLAARSVFDQNFAKAFQMGFIPEFTDATLDSAHNYFEL